MAALYTACQVGLVEPGGFDEAGAVGEGGLEDHTAPSGLARTGIPDLSDDGDLLAVFEAVDGLELRVVVVAAGEEVEHVTDGVDAQFCQPLGLAGAHSL